MTNERQQLIATAIEAMHDNPFDADRRCVLADIIEEDGQIWQAQALRAGRIPLTGFDQSAAFQLGNCRFAPATFDKKFANDIYSHVAKTEPCLTPRQWLWLWILLYRYRKSVRNAAVKSKAAERYNRYVELLDVKHLKPIDVRLSTPAPWADKFEPHELTAKDWLENGFECGCTNCEHMVSMDGFCEDCQDEYPDAEIGPTVIDENGDVFCHQQCGACRQRGGGLGSDARRGNPGNH